jgi:serine/threonine-protein kinase HipA
VGRLGHDPQANRFSFDYAAPWLESPSRFPLSPPLQLQRHPAETAEQHSAQVRQFFENLLPEGAALDHAAQAAGTTRSNLVGLLIAIGKETAGALRVTLAENEAAHHVAAESADSLREITPQQLSERILERENQPFSVWDGKVRLSLAGYQDKIAVYERENKWYLVEGSKLASTVIVKPAPMRKQLASLPANEHMCMQLARRVGVDAAETRLIHVPEPVLLVRRFDRIEHEGGVRRLHIVDGCQALGLAVSMKYERAYGDAADVAHIRDGVSFPKLFGLLEHSPLPAVDKRGLLRWAIFQVLIGNTDAHGKNVSFYCDEHGLRLAPAYDMVCMDALDAGFPDAYAMAIGDAFAENDLSPYEWAHFGYLCKLPFRLIARELDGLATKVIAVMNDLMTEMLKQAVPAPAAERFKEEVLVTCTRQLEHVQQIARFKQSDFA